MPYTAMGSVPDGLALEAEGDELVVTGSLTDPGPVDLFLWIRDSAGATSTPLVATLSAPVAWTVALAQLLHPFLENGRAPLTAAELLYLDDRGNRNGTYDVGDTRKWLRSQAP